MDAIEQRIRRSSRLKDQSTYQELLAYAEMVGDPEEVYCFMEENKIGVSEPDFWVAKLTLLKNQCDYREFIRVLKQVNRNPELRKHPKYWLVGQIEKELETHLERMLRNKVKGRRTAKEYEVLSLGNIQRQTRKFGQIEVYIDPDCREQYRLQDLVDFVTSRLQDDLEVEKNCYIRENSHKPFSFISKQREKINKMNFSADNKPGVNEVDRRTTGRRTSLIGRLSNKLEHEIVHTPDFKKKSGSKENQLIHRHRKSSIDQLDSIQILKHLARKTVHHTVSSKKKQQEINPEFDIFDYTSSIKKQKCRARDKDINDSGDICSEPDLDRSKGSIFSFGKEIMAESEQIVRCSQDSKPSGEQQGDASQDYAFIQYSEQEEANRELIKTSKSSRELQNVIKQIQMQKYESQTFSEIDSNKQNNFLSNEEDLLGLLDDKKTEDRALNQRRKFETIRKKGQRAKQQQDTREQQRQLLNDSSRTIYLQLLQCMGEPTTPRSPYENEPRHSMSEKERKRFSRISEERSYSFSESRCLSRSKE